LTPCVNEKNIGMIRIERWREKMRVNLVFGKNGVLKIHCSCYNLVSIHLRMLAYLFCKTKTFCKDLRSYLGMVLAVKRVWFCFVTGNGIFRPN